MVPSPTPFCPASNSSRSLKLLGITTTQESLSQLQTAPPVEVAIFPLKYVIQLYIRVSVVLSKSPARREMEKMISNLDSAELQQLLQLRV